MKKALIFLCALAMVSFAAPAFADLFFDNGGFETSDLTGWTIKYGVRDYIYGTETVNWTGQLPQGTDATVIGPGVAFPLQTTIINPYLGNYMVRLGDPNGYYHATSISQTSKVITQTDIDNKTKVYVDWGAALVEPSNAEEHKKNGKDYFPFFRIDVYKNDTDLVKTFTQNSDGAAGSSAWKKIGTESWSYLAFSGTGDIWYHADQWVFNLVTGGFAVGDTMRIEMMVADCGLGGHGAYAFLDGIGTVQPPDPNGVPEPSTMLLLGLGLVGLAGFRRKS